MAAVAPAEIGQMKAFHFSEPGPPSVMTLTNIPKPELRPTDVLILVKAVSVNPIDCKVRQGHMPKKSGVVGWDVSGMVVELGAEAKEATVTEDGAEPLRVGDEVFAAGDISRDGSYAHYVAIDHRLVARKPTSLSHEEAAAFPLVSLTAYESLVELAHVSPLTGDDASSSSASTAVRQRLLIIGGAGGVGSLAIQLAKQHLGMEVVATASRPETESWCRKLGADHVISHRLPLLPQLQADGVGGCVDVILCCAEPDGSIAQWPDLLNPLGRAVSILSPGAAVDFSPWFLKRLSFSLEIMFSRSLFQHQPQCQGAILRTVAALIDRKRIAPIRTRTLPWTQAQEAHTFQETGRSIGKQVLLVD